ncbi:MAG: ankyrin repeat domain-containing protein [Truepera sp.]|nr:ankyrin repeat domain-containing protein [Truepera sp.]
MRPKYLLVIWSVLVLAAQVWAADCGEWNTREFFEAVTVAEVQDCLAAGAEVNARNWRGRTPLHLAAVSNDNPAVTTALLAAGAEVNARDGEGWTPLHLATWGAWGVDNPAVVVALLEAGADANARNNEGRTPWDYAQENEDLRGTDAY